VTATGSSVGSGSVTVTGSYGGDSNNQASSGTFSLQVITPAIVPEYPIGLPLLAIFMIIAYGLIKRRTRDPQNI
jgi:ABC-type spermidine/putrescine transport system permease subunit II